MSSQLISRQARQAKTRPRRSRYTVSSDGGKTVITISHRKPLDAVPIGRDRPANAAPAKAEKPQSMKIKEPVEPAVPAAVAAVPELPPNSPRPSFGVYYTMSTPHTPNTPKTHPAPSFTHSPSISDQPLSVVDSMESFGIDVPSSPMLTFNVLPRPHSDELKFGKPLKSVDDGLSPWGLPKIIEIGVDDEEESDEDDGPVFGERRAGPSLMYMASLIRAHRAREAARKQRMIAENARKQVEAQREARRVAKQQAHFSFFGMWM